MGKRGRKPDLVKHAEMRRLYAQGLTLREVGAKLGVSKSAVFNALRRSGVAEPRRVQMPSASLREILQRLQCSERVWCAQCERSVVPKEAQSCGSQWCKAKVVAA